jgi:hypothetical protein
VISTALALAMLLAPPTAAEELLERSIRHHDPRGAWGTHAVELRTEIRLSERLASERGYATRSDRILLDPAGERFRYVSKRNDDTLEVLGDGDRFRGRLNGSDRLSDEQRAAFGLTDERLPNWRDYFGYVFGLPMKLRDPGTRIDPDVERTEFAGRTADRIRVTYDAEVGSDLWYFYFDPETAALIGSRFHHDEAANDGEYIVYEGEVRGPHGLRLPKFHRWFMNVDGEWIADDEVLGIASPE